MERRDKVRDMKGERWRRWLGLLMVLQLFVLPTSAAARSQCQGKNYTYSCDTFEEVLELPWEGGSKVCVVPHSDNARLRVRHSDIWGNKQEVVVRKKSLTPDTLAVLDIDVMTENSKDRLIVRINGTNLQPTDQVLMGDPRLNHLTRTTLLLKGDAKIMPCELEQEMEETASEMVKVGGKEKEVTQGPNKEIRTEGQEVTNASLTPPISSATTNTTETKDSEEEPWWSFMEVLGMVGPVPVLVLLVICLLVGILVGCILVCMCSKVCRKRRVEYVSVSAQRFHSMGPVDVVRNPSQSDTLGSRVWGTDSALGTLKTENESPFGTASSRGTSRTWGSNKNSMERFTNGTTRSAGVTNLGTRVNGSPNTSMNRSRNGSIQSTPLVGVNYYGTEQDRSPNNTGTRSKTQLGVNNLGTGVKRSPANASIGRIHNSAGTLNIPNNSSVTRSSSNISTDSNTRVMGRSPSQTRATQEVTRRNAINITKSNSINRNVNRSPNIPYTKNLGMLASHQERPLLQNPNIHHDSDEDSDDPNYDKPYEGAKPVLLESYSVPHQALMEPVSVELATMRASSNDPTARQIPVFQFGTFKK